MYDCNLLLLCQHRERALANWGASMYAHGGGRASLATNARPTRWTTRVHRSCCLFDRRQRCEVELVRRLRVQRRVRPSRVVEIDVPGDAGARLADRIVGVQVGEWRGGIAPPRSPRTGREPLDSSGSYRPTVDARLQCANREGSRARSALSQSQARNSWPRSRWYLRRAHRTRKRFSVRNARCSAEGKKRP